MVVRVVFVDADRQCIAAGVSCAVTDDKRADVLLCQPVQHFLPISRHTHIIPDNAGTPQTLTSHLTHHSLTHLMPLPPLSFASVKSRLVLPFWYRLTRVVLQRAIKRVCVCVCLTQQ